MIGFVLGFVVSNAAEWVFHKYVLHGIGKKKNSHWSFHFHEHHKNVRKTGGRDDMYERPLWKAESKSKELLSLAGTALLATPLLPISPGFVAASWIHSGGYYLVHKKAHLDPEWGRKWLPWHMDHHLGPNQDSNWCVTFPLFDYILGTREPWIGTPAELAAKERAAARAAASSGAPVTVAPPAEAALTA